METHKESMSSAEFIELAISNQLPNLWNVGVTLVKGDVKCPPKFECEKLDLSNYVFDGSLEFKEVKMEALIFNVFVSLELLMILKLGTSVLIIVRLKLLL